MHNEPNFWNKPILYSTGNLICVIRIFIREVLYCFLNGCNNHHFKFMTIGPVTFD